MRCRHQAPAGARGTDGARTSGRTGRRTGTVRRTRAGVGAAAVAVAAVLTLAGCGSGDGDNDAKKTPGVTATPSGQPSGASAGVTTGATPTTGASASDTPSGDSGQGVEGVWLATAGGSKVQLVLGKGKAGLTSTSLCGGTYTGTDTIGIILTCMDGNKKRNAGHGELSADGRMLTVRWSGGETDTFSRTGLPSS